MEHLYTSAVVSFAALFPIVDPIGIVPAFLKMTERHDAAGRRAQAAKGAIAAFALMIAFLFVGRYVLDFFDISLAAVEVVGGVVIGVVGWEMLTQSASAAAEDERDDGDIFFTPIAFPLLAGPGALAVILGLANRHDDWLDFPGFAIGIFAVSAISYLILSHAPRVLEALGPKTIDVINRILGLIVLAIAAELIFNGIADEFGLTTTDN